MTNDETGVSIVQTTADTVFQRVNDTEKEYWSSFAVRYRQLQEQIAEWDRRAFLKDARNQGLAEGHKQGLEQGRKEGLEQGLEQGLERGLERGGRAGRGKGSGRRSTATRRLRSSDAGAGRAGNGNVHGGGQGHNFGIKSAGGPHAGTFMACPPGGLPAFTAPSRTPGAARWN